MEIDPLPVVLAVLVGAFWMFIATRNTDVTERESAKEEVNTSDAVKTDTDADQGGKRRLVVMVGPPSVGKSTWTANNMKDSFVISRDDIAEQVAAENGWSYDNMFEKPTDQECLDSHPQFGDVVDSPPWMKWQPKSYSLVMAANNKVEKLFKQHVEAAFTGKKDIVVDMTNMSAKSRSKWVAKANAGQCFEIIAVNFLFEGGEVCLLKAPLVITFD